MKGFICTLLIITVLLAVYFFSLVYRADAGDKPNYYTCAKAFKVVCRQMIDQHELGGESIEDCIINNVRQCEDCQIYETLTRLEPRSDSLTKEDSCPKYLDGTEAREWPNLLKQLESEIHKGK